MSEFIGSRISLISKSDIRYVGTLHEINSENSTVALENVSSFGTEDRRPDDVIPGSDSIYEYIVFRGSDVKDLRIEQAPKKDNPPPQVPNDPAILGSGTRPASQNPSSNQSQAPHTITRQGQPPHFQQQPPYAYQQYNPRFGGPQGNPGYGGPPGNFPYSPMPYGAPPGWYPPPGQNFPQPPGPFSQHQHMPFEQDGANPRRSGQDVSENQQTRTEKAAKVADQKPLEQPRNGDNKLTTAKIPNAIDSEVSQPNTTEPLPAPKLPVESKPDIAAALAAPKVVTNPMVSIKPASAALKNGRIVPAIPLAPPAAKAAIKPGQAISSVAAKSIVPKPGQAAANAASQYQNASQAAAAAVAAAMANLPPISPHQIKKPGEADAVDNLTRKIHEMRTDDRSRQNRQANSGGAGSGLRGSRGGRRGGREQGKGLEVPDTDFDFESANAKFRKGELVQGAIHPGVTIGTIAEGEIAAVNGSTEPVGKIAQADVIIPPTATYSKSSFFDNISSEAKDREEEVENKRKPGGVEFRNEERKRNMDTFGIASVDSGRGSYRGRGRGRGSMRGGRGIIYFGDNQRGRGGYRGGSRGRGGSDSAAGPLASTANSS